MFYYSNFSLSRFFRHSSCSKTTSSLPNNRFLQLLAATGLILLALPLYAQTGYQWLATQNNADGGYYNAGSVSTNYQATSETLRAISNTEYAALFEVTNASQYIDNETYSSTEYLSRKIINNTAVGAYDASLINELVSRQNMDGGFGELAGYDTTVLDTSFALQALTVSGDLTNSATSGAIDFLLNHQHADGSWADGINVSNVYTTALAMQSLLPLRSKYSDVWDSANTSERLDHAFFLYLYCLCAGRN